MMDESDVKLDESDVKYIKHMTRQDRVNMTVHLFEKYRSVKVCTEKLGITVSMVKKYLIDRFSDKVKACIENKEFTIDAAMEAKRVLNDDISVGQIIEMVKKDFNDDDQLIATAKELTRLHRVPRRRRSKLCPNCSSKNTIYTMYGYPSEEFLKDLDKFDGVINGVKTEHGGCVVDEYSKKWTCDDCGHMWGRP